MSDKVAAAEAEQRPGGKQSRFDECVICSSKTLRDRAYACEPIAAADNIPKSASSCKYSSWRRELKQQAEQRNVAKARGRRAQTPERALRALPPALTPSPPLIPPSQPRQPRQHLNEQQPRPGVRVQEADVLLRDALQAPAARARGGRALGARHRRRDARDRRRDPQEGGLRGRQGCVKGEGREGERGSGEEGVESQGVCVCVCLLWRRVREEEEGARLERGQRAPARGGTEWRKPAAAILSWKLDHAESIQKTQNTTHPIAAITTDLEGADPREGAAADVGRRPTLKPKMTALLGRVRRRCFDLVIFAVSCASFVCSSNSRSMQPHVEPLSAD